MMVFDLHIHTRIGSGDSSIEYEDLVYWARQAGLDGICITEHGNKKTGVAEQLSRKYDFLVLEGMEMGTELGDILIFGIDELPRSLYRFEDIRRFVTKAGGVMFIAHPFRAEITRPIMLKISPKVSFDEAISRKVFTMVDGIEVANSWSCQEEVDFCLRISQVLGLKAIASSDAHMPRQIGCCVTVFHNSITDEASLVAELKRGNFHPEDRRPCDKKGPNMWF